MFVLNFKMFEALRDNLILIPNNTHTLTYNYIKKLKDKPFTEDETLLKKYKNISIDWYNTKTHNIIKRIRERTRAFSTSHFNNLLMQILDYFFNNYNFKDGYFALYLKERKISIMIKVKNNKTEIAIMTILLGEPPINIKMFEIDDYLIY